ncbi:A/G-specific adenine glycosylase [Legionella sp. CNM-4043-24]|uniref:A/G-specific adenine glycosylase n=1 Tax=Legionella sp. CNM-4043-24 TaxID=3421646 RepID=UPI00403A8727
MDKTKLTEQFSRPLLAWFDLYGRKNLPWQHPKTAYRVWISEIMLQQTQVQTVIPYFERFMQSFPDIQTLAAATEDQVLAHWSGLGYYSRARNIHKSAQLVCTRFNGIFPHELTALTSLPGIGDSTAAAIASQAFNLPAAILDGNVKRVLSRYFMVEGAPGQASVIKQLWSLACACMSHERPADYTQAIMDLGATCCTRSRPDCDHCPLRLSCQARIHERVMDFPFAKIKKIRPIRHEQFLLLHTEDQRIYLERRASPGLWGGLWCLPAVEPDCCPEQFVSEQYGLICDCVKDIMEIEHSFTHFHLHIKARSVAVSMAGEDFQGSGRWFTQEELGSVGLARPVTRIIQRAVQARMSGT